MLELLHNDIDAGGEVNAGALGLSVDCVSVGSLRFGSVAGVWSHSVQFHCWGVEAVVGDDHLNLVTELAATDARMMTPPTSDSDWLIDSLD